MGGKHSGRRNHKCEAAECVQQAQETVKRLVEPWCGIRWEQQENRDGVVLEGQSREGLAGNYMVSGPHLSELGSL